MLADAYNPGAPFFSAISTGNSAAVWLTGNRVSPYSVPLTGQIGFVQTEMHLGDVHNGGRPLREILSISRSNDNLLAQTYSEIFAWGYIFAKAEIPLIWSLCPCVTSKWVTGLAVLASID